MILELVEKTLLWVKFVIFMISDSSHWTGRYKLRFKSLTETNFKPNVAGIRKEMKYIIGMFLALTLSNSGHAAEKFAELQSGAMSFVRIHSSKHSEVNARSMALVKVSGLEDGCNSGVFLSAKEDKETLSFILAAQASKAAVKLGYDSATKSPWGDVNYCVLTSFDIK